MWSISYRSETGISSYSKTAMPPIEEPFRIILECKILEPQVHSRIVAFEIYGFDSSPHIVLGLVKLCSRMEPFRKMIEKNNF
jgi:hypothetical protein